MDDVSVSVFTALARDSVGYWMLHVNSNISKCKLLVNCLFSKEPIVILLPKSLPVYFCTDNHLVTPW